MIISKYHRFLVFGMLFMVLDKRYLGKPLKNRPILILQRCIPDWR
jgi:hypothetical protein